MKQAKSLQSLTRYLLGLATCILLGLLGLKAIALPQTDASTPNAKPIDVGMVTLLADPKRYDGKFIRTHGFLSLEFEGDALFMHEDDHRYGLTKNSFALRLSKSRQEQLKGINLRYVVIEGVMKADGLEQADKWDSAIGAITRLELWPIDRGPVPH